MDISATFVLFIGILGLALVILTLVIWVAVLTSRIKRLSNKPKSGAHQQTQETKSSPAETGSGMPLTSAAAEAYASQSLSSAERARSMQRSRSIPRGRAAQPMPMQDPMAPIGRPIHPLTPRVSMEGGLDPMELYDDQAFFDTYRNRGDGQRTGGFRRGRPSIPFGEDRNDIYRRESYYGLDALETDYDPDSVDFSRVVGYRNIFPR